MEVNEEILEAKDLNQQGIALLKVGNIDKAKEKFNRAVELEPMCIDSYKNLGHLNFKIGNYQDAKNYYKKALLIEKDGEIYYQYGNVCFMNDEPHEGLEYYNLALASGYNNDEMFFFMGMAYEHMNDDKMALRYIQKAIIKNPSRPDYKVKKVSILLRLNMIDEAKTAVDELLLDNAELYDGYHMKTAILLEEKKYDEAIKFSKSASDRFPEDPDLLYDYANVLALSGSYELALQVVKGAKSLKYFNDAKSRFILLEAEINAELGNITEAIELCDECISLETEDATMSDARFMRINLALTIPDFESALKNAEILINEEKNAYYYAALYFRPYCLNKLGRQDEAYKYFNEAISLYRLAALQNPEAFDAYLYRAMCLKDINEYDKALELLEFMENLSDEVAEIYTIRADIYKLTGKEHLMQEELEKAYRIKPELREAFGKGGE